MSCTGCGSTRRHRNDCPVRFPGGEAVPAPAPAAKPSPLDALRASRVPPPVTVKAMQSSVGSALAALRASRPAVVQLPPQAPPTAAVVTPPVIPAGPLPPAPTLKAVPLPAPEAPGEKAAYEGPDKTPDFTGLRGHYVLYDHKQGVVLGSGKTAQQAMADAGSKINMHSTMTWRRIPNCDGTAGHGVPCDCGRRFRRSAE